MTTLNIFCDGSITQNPNGLACSAFIAYWGDVDGRLTWEQIDGMPAVRSGACIALPGEHCTNNIAEFRAIRGALIWLEKNSWAFTKDHKVVIHSDSQLAVNQINGAWACGNEVLREIKNDCKTLISGLPVSVKLVWIRRELNNIADDLTRKVQVIANRAGKGVHIHV